MAGMFSFPVPENDSAVKTNGVVALCSEHAGKGNCVRWDLRRREMQSEPFRTGNVISAKSDSIRGEMRLKIVIKISESECSFYLVQFETSVRNNRSPGRTAHFFSADSFPSRESHFQVSEKVKGQESRKKNGSFYFLLAWIFLYLERFYN